METKLIKKIVEIKSISDDKNNCLKALKIIETEMKKNKIPCFIKFNKRCPFLIAGKVDNATILFLSHIDVVPAKKTQFRLRRNEGDKIFGRGVLDMKGPLIAALDAFIRLWRLGNNTVLFAITSDEETGGFNGAGFLINKFFKDIKLAIIPDSVGDDLVVIQKSPFHIRIFSKGKTAHGSKAWEGVNAAENLLKCCLEITNSLNGNSHKSTTATLTQFHSGEVTNMVPDKAEAVIDIRIRQQSEVRDLTGRIEKTTSRFNCVWEKIDEPMFFEANKNNTIIKKWISVSEKITNEKVKLIVENGASDARFIWQKLKIPIIVSSVLGGGAHSDNEWVDINSLNQLSVKIFEFISLVSKEKIISL